MAIPLTTYNTNEMLYAYMLANRYRSPFVYSPSGAELSEPDLWSILLNDTDIRGIRQRRNQNIVRPFHVNPSPHAGSKNIDPKIGDASKRMAAICHEALSYIERFDAARFLLADAFYLGRRYAEIEYEEMNVSLDGTDEMVWYIPVRVKDVDRRRFRQIPVWTSAPGGAKKSAIELHMFDTNSAQWVQLNDDNRRRFIEYVWESSEDRIGFGLGTMECLFYTHYFASGTLEKLVEAVDRFAHGFLKGKLDSLRHASTDLTNDQLVIEMKNTLNKMRTEHVAVLQDGDDVELMDMPATGFQGALALRRYFIESAERLCNGAVRQAGHSVDGTGAKAAAQEEGDTAESYYQFPREDMDSVIDRDLLGGFLYYNAGNFIELGMGDAKRPKFTSEQVKRDNPKDRLAVLTQAATVVPILASEIYDAANTPTPGPDDDVIGGPGSSLDPASQMGMGGGFGEKKPGGDKGDGGDSSKRSVERD